MVWSFNLRPAGCKLPSLIGYVIHGIIPRIIIIINLPINSQLIIKVWHCSYIKYYPELCFPLPRPTTSPPHPKQFAHWIPNPIVPQHPWLQRAISTDPAFI